MIGSVQKKNPGRGIITSLLYQWQQGDERALQEVFDALYAALRRKAGAYLKRERAQHTLQPTALVHEACLRLYAQPRPRFQNSAHFVAFTGRLMRQVLVDHARARLAVKRRGPAETSDIAPVHPLLDPATLIALDDALNRLSRLDSRRVQIIEMRFFAGMSPEETADSLRISTRTLRREWRTAKLWLARELAGGAPNSLPLPHNVAGVSLEPNP